MKSKKKFLLLGVGVMGALALGVGATSTFAWFVTTQSATLAQGNAANSGSIGVAETAGSALTLTAKVHFDVGAAQKYVNSTASALGSDKVLLTTWGHTSPSIGAGTAATDTTLLTAYKNGASGNPTYSAIDPSSQIGWIYFPVRAWIEDTSDSTEKAKADHVAVWKDAVNAITTNNGAKVTYSYSHTISGDDTTLGDDEVYMYGVEGSTAPTSYNKNGSTDASANSLGSTGVAFQIDAKDLTASNVDVETPSNDTKKKTIGFLCVRLEGSKRDHTHETSYSATISAATAVVTIART